MRSPDFRIAALVANGAVVWFLGCGGSGTAPGQVTGSGGSLGSGAASSSGTLGTGGPGSGSLSVGTSASSSGSAATGASSFIGRRHIINGKYVGGRRRHIYECHVYECHVGECHHDERIEDAGNGWQRWEPGDLWNHLTWRHFFDG